MSGRKVVGIVLGIAVGAGAPAASAAVRYASPTGAGTACSSSQPCDITTALGGSGVASGDEIVVGSGDYGSAGTPLTTALSNGGLSLTIHGVAGQPRPRFFFSASYGFELSGGSGATVTVRDLEIHLAHNFGTALSTNAQATVDQVDAQATGTSATGCQAFYRTVVIRDSVCVGTGTGSKGVGVQGDSFGGDATLHLRNVTAHGGQYGIYAYALTVATVTATATNTIARADSGGTDIEAADDATAAHSSITADHSNFGTSSAAPADSVPPPGSGSNQTAPPAFADTAHGDFHELAGSPTIDAGASDPANGTADLDGLPRVINGSPDIGAYEFPLAPSVTTGAASAITKTSATVAGSANPNGLDTTAVLQYGPTAAYGSTTGPTDLGASGDPQPVSVSLSGLNPGTTYHYRVLATNAKGSTPGADATFTTTSATSPAPPPPPSPQPPRLTSLRVNPAAFPVTPHAPKSHRRRRTGAVISYRDTQPATTTLTVTRLQPGVLQGRSCVKPPRRSTGHHRAARACVRVTAVGNVTHRDVVGSNAIPFGGTVNGHRLAPGRYRLVARAVNGLGLRSNALAFQFTIKR